MLSSHDLLARTQGRRRALASLQQAYAEQLAPQFTPFKFVDDDENGLSRVLGWMLDPKGDHAQGPRFLTLFLEWASIDWPSTEIGRAAVRTEAPVPRGRTTRRIDVLVTSGQRALAIEHKLAATDQPQQVADYLDHLGQYYPNTNCLVYLTAAADREPDEKSVTSSVREQAAQAGRFLAKDYLALDAWLTECQKESRAPSVTAFLAGLSLHVRRNILEIEDMGATKELSSEILESRDRLAAALDIYQTKALVEQSLAAALYKQIQERVAAHKDWTIEDFALKDAARFSGLVVKLRPDDRFGFGIGFDARGFRNFYYGMRQSTAAEEQKDSPSPRLLAAVANLVGSNRSTLTWPVWRSASANDPYFPMDLHPGSTVDFWLELQSGAFADRVVGFVAAMANGLGRTRRAELGEGLRSARRRGRP